MRLSGPVVGLVLASLVTIGQSSDAVARPAPPDTRVAEAAGVGPLAGKVVVLDAGHQLGNHNYPQQINRLVPAGGFKKACNTTGTSTNGGYPEATFAFRVTALLKTRLERAGAEVVLTRTANRQNLWGPCINVRGRAGNKIDADLKISIHADGSYGGGPGFHVIAPTDRKPWTHDIYKPSRRLATTVRGALLHAGLPAAGYVAGGDGLDFRSDLGTLNLSDVPTVMVESGNMRARADARRMTSASGRLVYARALARAVRAYLT
jgi:N-acetylmuramoyl-L-alanine amidase